MKKAFLRRMSLLAAGVLLATGLSGFSAEPGLSVFEDFSGFTTENSAPQGMSFGNLYAGINSFSPARGLAGKDRSDTSLLIHSAQAEYPEDWQTSMGKWVYNPNMNMNIGLSGLEECQKIHLSFQMLDKDYHVQKSMGMKISSQKPNGDGTWTEEAAHWANGTEYMLSMGVVNGSPEIRLFGSAEKAYRYNLGEWYRFDLVLNRETNDEGYAVMDVYINGESVWTAFPFKAGVSGTGSILTGLEALRFQYSTAVLPGTQNTRCSAAMGVDGIRASVVDAQTVPQFTKLAGTVYTDFSYIVSDTNYSSYYANGTSMAPISKDVFYGNFEPPESGRLPSVIVGGTEEKTGTIRFTAQNGVFGRPAEDQSLYLNNPKQFFPVSDDGPFRWFSEAYVGIQDTAATGLAAGDQFRCSISVAADENSHSGPMNTETRFIDSDGKAVTGASILSISNGLVPSVFGTVLDFSMEPQKWYQFDIICTVGEKNKTANTARVFINGQPSAEGIEFSASGKVEKDGGGNVISSAQVKGLSFLRVGYTARTNGVSAPGTDGTSTYRQYNQGGWYFDDIAYEPCPGASAAGREAALTSANPSVTFDKHRISGYSAAYTVAQFLEDTRLNGQSAAQGADLAVPGAAPEDKLDNKAVAVFASGRHPIYLLAENRVPEKTIYIDEDFSGALGDNTAPEKAALGGMSSFTTTGLRPSAGGKPGGDRAFYIETKGYAGTGANDPYVDFSGTPQIKGTATYEVSVKGPSGTPGKASVDSEVSVGVNGGTPSAMIMLTPAGDIWINGKTYGKWEQGKWYRFALTFHMGEEADGVTPVSYFLNGKQLKSREPVRFNTKINYLQRLKLINVVHGGDAANTVDAVSAFDDLKVYSGEYDFPADLAEVTSAGANVAVNQEQGLVHFKEGLASRGFFNALRVNGLSRTDGAYLEVFTDGSLTAVEGQNPKAGEVLAAMGKDGKAIGYYTLTNEPYIGAPQITIDGAEAPKLRDGLLRAAAEVTAFEGQQVTMVAALYTNGKLAALDTGTPEEAVVSTRLQVANAAESQVKIFFVDSLSALRPYVPALVIAP